MLIELDGVTKTYGKVAALRGLSVTLPEGSIGLLGPKGSGGGHPFSGAQETWVAPKFPRKRGWPQSSPHSVAGYLPGREREVGATRCDQQEHDGDECSERSRHETLTAQRASANDQDQRVRCIDWLDVRATFRGPGCADEGTLRPAIVRSPQEENRLPIQGTVECVKCMGDVHRPPQLAGPSIIGQLVGRMSRAPLKGVEGDLRILPFESAIITRLVSECPEGSHERLNRLPARCRIRPVSNFVGVGPPPAPLIPGRPSDAIVPRG